MTYKQRNVESKKFVTIGERIHCISPVIREAMATFNPDPILERAAQQIKAKRHLSGRQHRPCRVQRP